MSKKNKFSLSGVIGIIVLALVICFFILMIYVYQDLKSVENNVHNLYNQVRTQNVKIDQFGTSDENIAQQAMKFSEATKNWQTYQNNDFNFQLKSPVSWGDVESILYTDDGINYAGRRLIADFDKFSDGYLDILAETYDFVDSKNLGLNKLSSNELYKKLLINDSGECSHETFEALKNLNLGEIRNCFIRENILKQKFIVFRYVVRVEGDLVNQLVAVYPRETDYLAVNLPDDVLDEVDYFIQSIIFMK